MASYYCEDYEALTGKKPEPDGKVDAVTTKVIAAPVAPKAKTAAAKVETA